MLHSTELARPLGMGNSHCKTVGENNDKTEELIYQNSVAALPVVTYQAGETVIADRSRTARLLILRKGAVAIVKEDKEITKVTEPGAVFGEVSILLDQPNKVDVRALETSQFHIADAAVLLTLNPIAAHVAMVLARQLDNANDLQMNRTLPWIS
jgi:CRP/FNR family cyclic AMP-dependent transcriptional regulator